MEQKEEAEEMDYRGGAEGERNESGLDKRERGERERVIFL